MRWSWESGAPTLSRGAVSEAIESVWRAFGRSEGLISHLAPDAAWVRAQSGEFEACLPRLLELWAENALTTNPKAHEVLRATAEAWPELTSPQARSVEALGDVLWERVLTTHPSSPSADELLSQLVFLGLPMVRWLDPWLVSLDGPGAPQLADAIVRPAASEAWDLQPDYRQQLQAWAATEAVVIGLTVVGGVHLDEGDLAALFDRLI